jgi:hypothetical protein
VPSNCGWWDGTINGASGWIDGSTGDGYES